MCSNILNLLSTVIFKQQWHYPSIPCSITRAGEFDPVFQFVYISIVKLHWVLYNSLHIQQSQISRGLKNW